MLSVILVSLCFYYYQKIYIYYFLVLHLLCYLNVYLPWIIHVYLIKIYFVNCVIMLGNTSFQLRSDLFGDQVNTVNSLIYLKTLCSGCCFITWHIIQLKEAKPLRGLICYRCVYMTCSNN